MTPSHDELAALKPRPTLVLSSGLYELFRITLCSSFACWAGCHRTRGMLLYTGQPRILRLKTIARSRHYEPQR
ncbi:class I SAM-dependent methyltransferase family protein [Salmonella enterica subsp. enterica]|nr:class I SAM-dependent methyltransferase family protein [Salmonella enterica subsp. enterica]